MIRGYIYLASPYSHEESAVRNIRFARVSYATSMLLAVKVAVFSPIVHCHPLVEIDGLPKDANFWKFYNREMLRGARELWLLLIDGWKESKGMMGERDMAIELGIPYQQVEPSAENLRKLAQRIHELHPDQ